MFLKQVGAKEEVAGIQLHRQAIENAVYRHIFQAGNVRDIVGILVLFDQVVERHHPAFVNVGLDIALCHHDDVVR